MYETTGYAQSEPQCASDTSSPIASEVKGIRQGQDTTSDLLGELAARLKPVLNAAIPKPENAGKAIAPSLSPLHGDLYSAGERQQAINARIRDLIDRLTV